jgi:FMN phosphatase YigB (HAD superfamily)
MVGVALYELFDHAGEIPFNRWELKGIRLPIFDKDNTLTSFHDDVLIQYVVDGLINNGLADIYHDIAIVSNSEDPQHIREVAGNLGEILGGVNVFSVSKGEGYNRKPDPEMGLVVAEHFNLTPNHLGVIGDRRLVDVKFGRRLNAGAIALCGKVGEGDARGVPLLRLLESTVVYLESGFRTTQTAAMD